mgnify:CR=1 FL=1|jgi:preprotein translocase subunit SecB
MADEKETSENAATDKAAAAQFGIERIYVKDISLESPRGQDAFKTWAPTINLDINTKQTTLQEGVHEVVLTLTINVSEKETDAVYFLIEIQQAGLFRTANIPDAELRRLLATLGPSTLFPYARETVDSLATKAGFPPLRLSPINFDAMMQAAMQKQGQVASGPETIQ